ncbi:MAG: hypothetical protein K5872_22340 [Rhizobiaceae bacterium]|nr:hypothetical protein [Rhizobiaceae bacterium]MCV0408961.1 hypothetical protein [Rhizobiaceae bacterium]
MAGLLGYLAAGAAEGAGKSIVEQAKAKREAALEELRTQREMEFRRGEREASQAFTASENDRTRAHSTEQKRLDREASGEVVRDEEGRSLYRVGDKVSPLTDTEGNEVKVAGGSKFEIDRRHDMLVAAGVDPKRAARIAAGDKPPTDVEIEKMVETAVKTEFAGSFSKPKPEEVDERRNHHRERMRRTFGLDEAPDDTTRKGVPDEASVIQQAKDAVERGAPASAVRQRLQDMGIDPAKAGL